MKLRPKGWRIKHYKGLGTHDDKEATQCFEEFDKQIIHYDGSNEEKTTYAINLGFSNKEFCEIINEKEVKNEMVR